MPAERPMMKSNENRRSNKPIMEKRRRARINSCLNELKALILEALKKDPARHSKLEKADILEMTVKHLQNLQRQQIALQAASNPNVTNKFRAGYHECANEVSKYLRQIDVDTGAQQRLLNHLSNCIEFLNRSDFHVLRTTNVTTQPLNIRVTSLMEGPMGQLTPLPTPNALDKSPNSSLPVPVDYHLVPTTRMANGDLAVLLPSPPPALIRNTFSEISKRLSPVPRQEMMSQFRYSGSAVAPQQSSAHKAFILPSTHSPIDLCGGSKGGKLMTAKEPWRPW